MIDTVIFDLGGVLINWDPKRLFRTIFDDETAMNKFLNEVCTMDWNEQQDAGRPIAEANRMLIEQFPDQRENIEAYYGRWTEMLGGPIAETVEILKELKETGQVQLYALTNWSAELFPEALRRYEFLQYFKEILVSGKEGIKKPSAEIFERALSRFDIDRERAVFIDDSAKNIAGSEAVGLRAIQFKSPAQLRRELTGWGLLRPQPYAGRGAQPKYRQFLTEELPALLRTLPVDRKANFGLMTPQHMVEHLSYVTKVMPKKQGAPPTELSKSQQYFRRFVDKGCPFEYRPRDGVTASDLSPLRAVNMEAAIRDLEGAIQRLYDLWDQTPDHRSYNEMMGSFNLSELERFAYQHGRWHAYQFGLLDTFEPVAV